MPYSVLARYNADTRQLQDVELLQRNQDLRDAIASKDLPKAESFTVPNAGMFVSLLCEFVWLVSLYVCKFVYLFL